jgi:hypothetical protein
MAGGMLHFAPMTALVRCVCEIDGMAEGQVWAVCAARPKGRFGPFAPHLVEGRTATLSALLPSVESAANDWIEPKLPDVALRSNGSNLGRTGRSASMRYAYS